MRGAEIVAAPGTAVAVAITLTTRHVLAEVKDLLELLPQLAARFDRAAAAIPSPGAAD